MMRTIHKPDAEMRRMSRSTCSTSITTYAIEAARGSHDVAVNGAAARLVQTGDRVIVVAHCQIPAEEARNYHPTVVVLVEGHQIASVA
jgi:aspartate 1-decarboxylase